MRGIGLQKVAAAQMFVKARAKSQGKKKEVKILKGKENRGKKYERGNRGISTHTEKECNYRKINRECDNTIGGERETIQARGRKNARASAKISKKMGRDRGIAVSTPGETTRKGRAVHRFRLKKG